MCYRVPLTDKPSLECQIVSQFSTLCAVIFFSVVCYGKVSFQQIGQVLLQRAECSLHPGDLNLPYILVSSFKVHCYPWQLVTHTLFIIMHSLKLGTMLSRHKTSGKSFAVKQSTCFLIFGQGQVICIYEPSGPPGWSFSQFLSYETSRSISTSFWMGCQSIARAQQHYMLPFYIPGWGGTV